MSLLDRVTSIVAGGGEHAQVAGGLLQELQQPGGISGVFQSFQQNGLGGLVQQWAGGQTQPATPGQMEQGLGGTGIIDRIAERTGVSPAMVKMGLAAAVPIVVHHFAANGHVNTDGQATGAPPPEPGVLLQSIIAKLG